MFTKEQMKENAVRNLITLDCYKPYKEKFRRSGVVTMYEDCIGFYVDETQNRDVLEIIKKTEEEHNGLVYAVIHNYTEFGECYTLLWQTRYEEDDEWSVEKVREHGYYVWAYVYNKDFPEYSEFGTVAIMSVFGGLNRI